MSLADYIGKTIHIGTEDKGTTLLVDSLTHGSEGWRLDGHCEGWPLHRPGERVELPDNNSAIVSEVLMSADVFYVAGAVYGGRSVAAVTLRGPA